MTRRLPSRASVRKAIVSFVPNILLPFAVYKLLMHAGYGSLVALAGSALISIVKIALGWVRTRSIDLISCFVIFEVALAITVSFLFHNPRLILLKGPIQAGGLGLVCLVSVAVDRPLGAWLSRTFTNSFVQAGIQDCEGISSAPLAVRPWRDVTLFWGIACTLDAIVRALLVFHIPPGQYLLISRIMQEAFFAFLGYWTVRSLRQVVSPSDPPRLISES